MKGNHTTHGLTNIPEHKVWMSMHSHVRDKYKSRWYKGIRVCERWSGKNGFVNFLADMGTRPFGLTLDRINNKGPYSPENCRWTTMKDQCKNRRHLRISRTGRKLR